MEGTAGHDALAMRRREIDALDAKLLELLNQRAEISLEVGRIKRASGDAGAFPVHDPIRERELLARLAEINRGPLASGQIRAISSPAAFLSTACTCVPYFPTMPM